MSASFVIMSFCELAELAGQVRSRANALAHDYIYLIENAGLVVQHWAGRNSAHEICGPKARRPAHFKHHGPA